MKPDPLPDQATADAFSAPEGVADEWRQTLHRILADDISQLYDAETQLAKALPKMLEAAAEESLKLICQILEIQTKDHILRLNRIVNLVDSPHEETTSQTMEGLLLGVQETIAENPRGRPRDFSLIAAAQKISQYQITSYCCARDFAQLLQLAEVVKILQSTIDDETGMDAGLANLTEFLGAGTDDNAAHLPLTR